MEMKVGRKVIFLLKDRDGFGSSISEALQPKPNSAIKRTESSFDLSLEKYGIKDQTASGHIINFVDPQGSPQVSIFLLQNYEVPVAACAVNEALASMMADNPSDIPTIILPFIVESPKLNWETTKATSAIQKVSVRGAQIGPATEFTNALLAGVQKLPPTLPVSSEPLACLLLLIRVLKLPTVLLAGSNGHNQTGLFAIGEFLASSVGLCIDRDKIHQNATVTSKTSQEPWRAFYI